MAKPTTITITDEDIRSSSWDLARYMLMRPQYAIPIALFLIGGLFFTITGIMEGGSPLLWAGIGLLAMTALLPFLLARQAARNFRSIMPTGSKLRTLADDEGLHLSSPLVTQKVPWNDFDHISTVGKTVIMRQHKTNVTLMMPERAYSEETLALARERVGKKG